MNEFERLVELVARLRGPDGCPWDRAQTHASLKGMLLEEAYETMAEIERGDPQGLQDELGDLLLHVVLHAQIAREAGTFTIQDVIRTLIDKIVRRHPHVFGTEQAHDPAQVKRTWERVKRAEGKGRLRVGAGLPALVAARKLQDRAANAGQALPRPVDPQALRALLPEEAPEAGIGALLFAAVALARQLGVEPEWALLKHVERLQRAHDTPAPA